MNACDAGREGELIFRYVVQLAGCQAPVRRLWVSSMTDQALRDAWAGLEDGSRYDTLADAARCRAEADWLIGLNATRAMTCLARKGGGGQLLSVGRVQTPTLAMIVRRDAAIASFEPEAYWQVRARFAVEGDDAAGKTAAQFEATWFQLGGLDGAASDKGSDDDVDKAGDGPSPVTRLPTAEAAAAVAHAADGRPGVVTSAEFKRKVERPPLLYDLTSLQRRANQRHGFSADRTLQVAQALYEKHKLLTYPRTDARHLTPDQVPGLRSVVEAVGDVGPYAAFAAAILEAGPIRPGRRVVDAGEVGDHHAIIPTTNRATRARLSPDEKRLYDLVARRFLAALSRDAQFDTARLVVAVQPAASAGLPQGVRAPLMWRAQARICVDAGWQAVDPPRRKKERLLPELAAGDATLAEQTTVKAGQTRPPSHHTDASILKAMETAGRELDDAALKRAMRQSGLGTPATRAAILNTLLQRQYIVREGKQLRATERGKALVLAVPVEELKSAALTGRWEARLARIAEGVEERRAFMADVKVRTHEVVSAILAAAPPPPETIEDDRPSVGACPVCGSPVREGRGAWSCEKGRACSFVIFKTFARRKISKRSAMQLLKDGRTPVLKNFRSKK
ncbi:MAG: DNA topoisomerase, partial [Myxococcota bacterium]|nr:DNA topoisomerase [Myxococcota bacterium]